MNAVRVRTGPVPGSGPVRFWTSPVQNWTGLVSDLFWTGTGPCAEFLTNYVCGGEGEKAVLLFGRSHNAVLACTGRYCRLD